MPHRRRSASLLALALIPLLSACPSNQDDQGEEVGETGGTESTDETESTSDESSDDESTDETEATGTDETSTDETETSTDETETGIETGDPSLNEEQCMQGCAVYAECFGPAQGCFEYCFSQLEALEGECLGFEQALNACIIGLTCEEIEHYTEGEPEPFPCQVEEEQACHGSCGADVDIGGEPGECSYAYICPDDPTYAVECDGDSCNCIEDDVVVGGCSGAVELCAELGELGPDADPLDTCCGWQLG